MTYHRNNSAHRREVHILAATLMVGVAGAAHAGHIHYKGPNIDYACMKMDGRAASNPDNIIVEFWAFYNAADHTLDDPIRPPMVLGPSGPWLWELTEVDPFGNPMPYLGIRFFLADDGVGIGTEGAVFVHPTHYVDADDPIVTDYWLDNDGWHKEEMIPAQYYVDIPPDVIDQGTAAVYQFVWDSFWASAIPGDVNGDGCVDQADLSILLAAFNSAQGDPHWNPNADLNGDGFVGQADLGLLLALWGEGC